MCLFLSLPDTSDAVEYGAEIGLTSYYSDNISLAPSDLANSQMVNALVPRVYLTQIAPRYEVSVDYKLEALFYPGESDRNQAYSDLWATGNLALLTEELFLDGFARLTQVNVDPTLQNPDDNIYITGNRSDAIAVRLGPRWQRFLFRETEIDALYYVGRIDYEDDLQGVDSQDARLSLGSTNLSSSQYTYNLTWRYQNFDYDDTGPVKIQRLRLNLGYFVTPFFQLAVGTGSESNLGTNDGKLGEPFWEVGFRSWFGSNALEAFYGRRFYGPTYRFIWRRAMRNSNFRVSYRETQNTDEGVAFDDLETDLEAGISPDEDQSLVPVTGIDRPGSGARAINKIARADFRWSLYRTDVLLSGFWRNREEIAAVPGLNSATTDESINVRLRFSWAMGTHTTTSLTGVWTQRKFDTEMADTGNDSDNYRVDARVDYGLGLWTTVYALGGIRTQKSTNLSYDEAHVGIGFSRYFRRRPTGQGRSRIRSR